MDPETQEEMLEDLLERMVRLEKIVAAIVLVVDRMAMDTTIYTLDNQKLRDRLMELFSVVEFQQNRDSDYEEFVRKENG